MRIWPGLRSLFIPGTVRTLILRSLRVLLARVEGSGAGTREEGGGSEKTEEEGEGWREGEETAQQTPNTSPRRFTAMRYSYLCLIDCIGGGSSTMCRPFQRATRAPLFFFPRVCLRRRITLSRRLPLFEFPPPVARFFSFPFSWFISQLCCFKCRGIRIDFRNRSNVASYFGKKIF